jgi:hypothetical protein
LNFIALTIFGGIECKNVNRLHRLVFYYYIFFGVKFLGDVQKEVAKSSNIALQPKSSASRSNIATPTKQTIQADEFRESPGLKAADLLLSLNKPVVASMGAARDSTLQLVPNQVGNTTPLYQVGLVGGSNLSAWACC